jgi:hypothetical protein
LSQNFLNVRFKRQAARLGRFRKFIGNVHRELPWEDFSTNGRQKTAIHGSVNAPFRLIRYALLLSRRTTLTRELRDPSPYTPKKTQRVRRIFLNLCSNPNSNPASGASFPLDIRGFKYIGIIAPRERFSATKLGTVFWNRLSPKTLQRRRSAPSKSLKVR